MNSQDQWTVYRTRFLVRACQLTKPLTFTDALGREHSGEPGDYLVESSAGCFRITARHIFEDVYVPLSSAHPQDIHEKQVKTQSVPTASPVGRARMPALHAASASHSAFRNELAASAWRE